MLPHYPAFREYSTNLNVALSALQESSRLLTASVRSGSDRQIEECLAAFSAAKSRVYEVLDSVGAVPRLALVSN